ncbi:unnamed protein product [Amoebophrya sp. A120]|nr:unnamed protein product [Amoebophrya sp. A120]|eukprot:GSA120T00002026001.1
MSLNHISAQHFKTDDASSPVSQEASTREASAEEEDMWLDDEIDKVKKQVAQEEAVIAELQQAARTLNDVAAADAAARLQLISSVKEETESLNKAARKSRQRAARGADGLASIAEGDEE